MKTSDNNFQQLVSEATSLYDSEKEIASILSLYRSESDDAVMNDWVALEVEENKRQCARLEGFIAVLDQVARKESQHELFMGQLNLMLKRMISKHARYGNKDGIIAAFERSQATIAVQ